MSSPLYRAWTKGTRREAGLPRRSLHWITARRAWLKVFDDRLECGDWVIPIASITEVVLYDARQGFFDVPVLAVSTPDGAWQFGLNPWVKIADHLPFEFRRERVRLRWSAPIVVLRLAAFAYLAYVLFWQR